MATTMASIVKDYGTNPKPYPLLLRDVARNNSGDNFFTPRVPGEEALLAELSLDERATVALLDYRRSKTRPLTRSAPGPSSTIDLILRNEFFESPSPTGHMRTAIITVGANHTPFHTEKGGMHGMALLIVGEKCWTLSPPGRKPQATKFITYQQRAGDLMVIPSGWWHRVDTTDGALMVGYDFGCSIAQFHRGNTAVYGDTMVHDPTAITAELVEAGGAFKVRVPTRGVNGTAVKGTRNAIRHAIRRTVASTGTALRGLTASGNRKKSKANKWSSSLLSVTTHLLLYSYTPIAILTHSNTKTKKKT